MKKILAFAMAAVLMLGLAACGGSGASAPASSAAGSASASSGASGQDSAGGTSVVEEIQEKGVLTMMTATGFPPFEYLGEDGKPAGVDIDLAQLVADELGVELEVLDMDFNLLIESLKSGKGQLIAAGMTATPERAEQIDFSITYTLNGLILLVPKGSDIKTADDLAGKNIAVQESTTAHIYAQEELGIEPLAFKNANECATAVMGGKADAAILDAGNGEPGCTGNCGAASHRGGNGHGRGQGQRGPAGGRQQCAAEGDGRRHSGVADG